ncbi:MAG: ABC-three component system middle component 6 [Bacteroidia bacterium]
MLKPTKYENLNKNPLVIGSFILRKLKVKPYNLEDLYQTIKKEEGLNLDQFFNCISFLWLADAIELNKYQVKIITKSDSK